MSLLERAATFWAAWMGPMAVQAGLLILAVWLADWALRRWAWPQVRWVLWTLVLVKLVAPPGLHSPTGIAPHLAPALRQRATTAWVQMTAPRATPASRGSGPPGRPRTAEVTDPRPATPALSPPRWVVPAFLAWAAGVVVLGGFLLLRLHTLRRWHDRQRGDQSVPSWYYRILVQTANRLGVSRLPAVVFSDRLLTPAVCGVVRPVLYLPRHYTESLGPEEAEFVLLHELAHLKRGDLWQHALWMLVQVLYWFHPLVAVARWQAQHVREICTDLAVASVLRERTAGYRDTLLRTARRLLTESPAPGIGLLGVFEEPFRLVARLRWLDRPTWVHRRAAGWTAAVLGIALLIFVLPMAPRGPRAAGLGTPDPFAALAPAPLGTGEVLYVRFETHTESYLVGVRTMSFVSMAPREMWIGEDRLAWRDASHTVIVDAVRGVLIYISHSDETFVVAPLPLERQAILLPKLLVTHPDDGVTGEVRDVGRGAQVLGRPCREFELETWRPGADRKSHGVSRLFVWDETLAHAAAYRLWQACGRELRGYDPRLRTDCERLDGLTLRNVRHQRGFFAWADEVSEAVEMKRLVAPAAMWEPPAGYVQRDRIWSLW